MEFTKVQIDNKDVVFVNSGKQLQIVGKFQKGENHLTFEYSVKPKQALYFVDIEGIRSSNLDTRSRKIHQQLVSEF